MITNRRSFLASCSLRVGAAGFISSHLDRFAIGVECQVPEAFAVADPDLRSPLIFNDGSSVKTAEDWQRRRNEIRADWTSIVGDWPELIDKPSMRVSASTVRSNVQQDEVFVGLSHAQEHRCLLLKPSGDGPFPAVVVPFYEPETSVGLGTKPLRDFAWQLANRGFVAIAIGSPGGDARKPAISTDAACQPLMFLGYLAANAWHALASLDFVDAKRIGIVGHSYGGKWSLFGSCLWDKFACAVWSDPGIVFDETRASINYQEPWYLGLDDNQTRKAGLVTADNPRTGAYKRLIEAGRNLHELHALMAPRPFLVSGGAEDPVKRWSALQHTVDVNRLLGYADRVCMTNRPTHDPTFESNETIYRFFQRHCTAA